MKTINTNEDIPKEFHVFLDFSDSNFDQINKHNYELNNKITSSGISNLFMEDNRESFVNGGLDYLPFIRNESEINRHHSPSSFMMKIINDYNVEYNLELTRKYYFKTYPSRLSGIFAFGDYETCELVNSIYGWDLDKVKKFKLVDFGPLNKFLKIGKFNMEIVSLIRSINASRFSPEKQNYLYRNYWNGSGKIELGILNIKNEKEHYITDTIYEYIIEGSLEEIK